jgi:hypothetical protein
VYVETSPDIPVEVERSADRVQLVGTLDQNSSIRWRVDHTVECPGWTVELIEQSGGRFSLLVHRPDEMATAFTIEAPWAIDASGAAVPTWYESDGSALVQVVDARSATLPVRFDPTYSAISCEDHIQFSGAFDYLDLDDDDSLVCPIWGIFDARLDYRPVMAYEANVDNDHGLVAVKEFGGCSPPAPDTGIAFDFQLPCRAHDYCYDLRKAGFSGVISDDDCDFAFYDLMLSHCDDRVLSLDCEVVADSYHVAVSLPGVVTDPDPALIEIVNLQSGSCMDVEGPSWSNGAPIQQWECVDVDNQHFRAIPSDDNVFAFLIQADHSSKCIEADLVGEVLTQQTCDPNEPLQNFYFVSMVGTDTYTFRDDSSNWQNCSKPPGTPGDGDDLVHPYCDDTSVWVKWQVQPA